MDLLVRAGATPPVYLPPRLAFRAAFRWALAYFFIALRCFLEAFFSSLFCCLADFLDTSRELRAHSATPGLCALDGGAYAALKAANSVNSAIRFTGVSLLSAQRCQSTPVSIVRDTAKRFSARPRSGRGTSASARRLGLCRATPSTFLPGLPCCRAKEPSGAVGRR